MHALEDGGGWLGRAGESGSRQETKRSRAVVKMTQDVYDLLQFRAEGESPNEAIFTWKSSEVLCGRGGTGRRTSLRGWR